jgi:hypothetical protein
VRWSLIWRSESLSPTKGIALKSTGEEDTGNRTVEPNDDDRVGFRRQPGSVTEVEDGNVGYGSSKDSTLAIEIPDGRRDAIRNGVLVMDGVALGRTEVCLKLDDLGATPGCFRLLVRSGIGGGTERFDRPDERETKDEVSDPEGVSILVSLHEVGKKRVKAITQEAAGCPEQSGLASAWQGETLLTLEYVSNEHGISGGVNGTISALKHETGQGFPRGCASKRGRQYDR